VVILLKLEEILDIVLRAAKITIESGAEIYRVELLIDKILEAYNVRGEHFVVASGIFLTIYGYDNQAITRVIAIRGTSINFQRLEQINNFSRSLHKNPISYEEAIDKLSQIEKVPLYPFSIKLIAACMLSFAFTFFFDGTLLEAIASGVVATMVYTLQVKMLSKYFFMFFDYLVASFIGGILCLAVTKLFSHLNLIRIIIGMTMILLPGLTIITALKEVLNGNVVSSNYKFFEAIVILTAMGIGITVSLSVGLG
jgi:uncharacterized membrane protein YjjP (DUF1212 family)